MPHWRSKTEKMQALHEAAQAERWPFVEQDSKRPFVEQDSKPERSRRMVNGTQMLEWFLWGVFMGGGWFIIQWLLAKVLH